MSGLSHRGMFPKGCGPNEDIRDVDVSGLPAAQQKYQPWDGSTLYSGVSGDADLMMPSQRSDRYVPVVGPGTYYCLGTESKELAVAIYWGFRDMNARLKGKISASNPAITMEGRGHWQIVEPAEFDAYGRRVFEWIDTPDTLEAKTKSLDGPWDLLAETGRVFTRDFPVPGGNDTGPGATRVYPAGDIRNIVVNGRPYQLYTSDSNEGGPEYPVWDLARTSLDDDHVSPESDPTPWTGDGSMRSYKFFRFGQFGILNRASYEGGGLIHSPGDGVVPFWDGKYWFTYGCVISSIEGYATVSGGWNSKKPGTPFPPPHLTPFERDGRDYTATKNLSLAIGFYGEASVEHTEPEAGSVFDRVKENIAIPVKMIVGDASVEGVMNGYRNYYEFFGGSIPDQMKPDLTVTELAVEIELRKYHTLGGLRNETTGATVPS